MQDAKQRQSGGIIAFIVVGVVLAALLGGAIYASKQQGRVASKTDTVATNDQKTDDTSTETPQNDTSKDDDKNESTSGSGNSNPAPAPAQPAPTTPQPTTPAPGSGPGSSVPTTGPSHIATTGPEDAVVPGLGLALLAAGIVSYRRSHVAVRVQALKQ